MTEAIELFDHITLSGYVYHALCFDNPAPRLLHSFALKAVSAGWQSRRGSPDARVEVSGRATRPLTFPYNQP